MAAALAHPYLAFFMIGIACNALVSGHPAAGHSPDVAARFAEIAVTDPDVVAASQFALAEVRRLCDACDSALRDTYQSARIHKILAAAVRTTTALPGRAFLLHVILETSNPVTAPQDAQKVVVFQDEDGSFGGLSLEHSPFLSV
eukprot:jgi/Mesvir1/26122/Mv06838-RA.1